MPIDNDNDYAIVHSRPGSRHSTLHGQRAHRGPPSNIWSDPNPSALNDRQCETEKNAMVLRFL